LAVADNNQGRLIVSNATSLPTGQTGGWIARYAPVAAQPYLRLARADKPIGGWLLMWPCFWSAALAAEAKGWRLPDLWHLVLFFAGAHVMRGAGCAWNDFLDRDIDGKVERTRSRPIPGGEISPKAALVFMVALAAVGLLVLLQFNSFARLLGALSLLPVAVYPLMKRITHWPQAVLGLAFGWGALMGWAGEFASLAAPPLLLYAASIAWIIGYDTIYAHQDREDDALIGLKSTALKFGTSTPYWLSGFYAGFWLLLAVAARETGAGWPFSIVMLLLAGQLAWQIATLDIGDPANCLVRFRSNHWAGALIFAGLLADMALRAT
jgi:4-hydroxybenzoate polyprenyltransferase